VIILICGDRNWTDYKKIRTVLQGFPVGFTLPTQIIHGAAKGADSIGEKIATEIFGAWN